LPDSLNGTVSSITFFNEESMFTVARLLPQHGKESVTIVGNMPPLREGDSVSLEGFWKEHPRYGRQFHVQVCKLQTPVTKSGIERFLSSGLIKGVGPVMAKRLVDAFGEETLAVIETSPERLQEVEGIGAAKAEAIADAYRQKKSLRDIMLFLQEYGVSPALALRVYKHYGDQTISILRENPYRLAEEAFGFGFKTADRIARQLGIPADSPYRLASCLLFTLEAAAEDGHLYLPQDELLNQSRDFLGGDDVTSSLLLQVLEKLLQAKKVLAEGEGVERPIYLHRFYIAEQRVAYRLNSLISRCQQAIPLEQIWAGVLQAVQIDLAPEQKEALKVAWNEGLLVVTGGPGTGKTTTVKALIELFRCLGLKTALAAPTGRAAKRLSEAAGMEAKTIHRLLEYGFSENKGFDFHRNSNNPLDCQALIVDEVSMVDLLLFDNLLQSLRPNTRLVLVGDVDQLPSIGAGNVLRDLLASGVVPAVRLHRVFRQAQESMITLNAHRINRGQFPLLNQQGKDFFFLSREEPDDVAKAIVELVAKRLPDYGGFDPIEHIQVLAPMRRTPVGVDALNRCLQRALNPPVPGKSFLRAGGYEITTGDRVMQIKNNYQKEVFNGDVGRVVSIDGETGDCIVSFPDLGGRREVLYESGETDELTLAYAASVHKSQGSEYPAVVMPVVTQHYVMLQRNLLYTAVTRAKKMMVLVGSKKALAIAVRNNKVGERYSRLAQLLAKG